MDFKNEYDSLLIKFRKVTQVLKKISIEHEFESNPDTYIGYINHIIQNRIEARDILNEIDDSQLKDKTQRIKNAISDIKFGKLAMCPQHNLDEPNENVPCECEIFKDIEDKAWKALFDEIEKD